MCPKVLGWIQRRESFFQMNNNAGGNGTRRDVQSGWQLPIANCAISARWETTHLSPAFDNQNHRTAIVAKAKDSIYRRRKDTDRISARISGLFQCAPRPSRHKAINRGKEWPLPLNNRAIAQFGSVLGLGLRDYRFESCCPNEERRSPSCEHRNA